MSHLSSDIQVKLKNLSKTNGKVKKIIKNIDEYPMEIIEMLIKNPETVDFVLNYPEKKDHHEEAIVASTQNTHGVPDFKQWDQRWGYEKYGDNIIGLCGCGPTSLSMVVVGLTGDNSITPKAVAQYSESRGYYFNGKGTSWDLMTKGCKKYGITSREVSLSEKSMARELQCGRLIICSMSAGDFTTDGHFIVIHDYEDGKFIVNDPNSIKLSARRWSYSELSGQINNLWSFSKIK